MLITSALRRNPSLDGYYSSTTAKVKNAARFWRSRNSTISHGLVACSDTAASLPPQPRPSAFLIPMRTPPSAHPHQANSNPPSRATPRCPPYQACPYCSAVPSSDAGRRSEQGSAGLAIHLKADTDPLPRTSKLAPLADTQALAATAKRERCQVNDVCLQVKSVSLL